MSIQERIQLRTKITKWHNSMRNEGGDIIIVLCTLSDDGLYLY